jgi:hypothetical protein
MKEIFNVLLEIKTPLVLGGIAVACFFFILRIIIQKNLIPQVSKTHSFNLIILIINRFFILALIAILLGFIGYVIPLFISSSRNNEGVFSIDDMSKFSDKGPTSASDIVQLENISESEAILALTISNTGKSIMVVEKIETELGAYSDQINNYKVVYRESGNIDRGKYKFKVTLRPNQKLYLITDEISYYPYGEIERIPILFKTMHKGVYLIVVRVTWFPAGDVDKRRSEVFGKYRIIFQEQHGA